ncbi:DUF3302 domain-containing protein [Photobacterium swingsii]|uniref:DUF3302 domain-containing protein n=1 Tax=Photobacterium swingsii TaxID=680026 RepID=A0A0J8XSY0_9GAMM|nr:DUF3302 domain-containing protein [Photobacterium swingsii]KMV28484.1 GTPase [Photobacterium swingsii]PSW22779.1 DUF3302 domain-containing protein [Photobacterium swingsii]
MFLDYFALGLLVFVALVLFYGIIVIHDIPYEISKERDHPHQDAIHYAGWVSLFTLHALWPFLWIWATLWRKDRGWGFQKIQAEQNELHHQINTLSAQVELLSHKIATLEGTPKPVSSSEPPEHTQENQTGSDQTGEEK